jgi:Uma2 family endonuclease
MNIEEMKQKKQEKGYTYAQIADRSGVPLGTVQKVFSGETANPRYETLQALESFFGEENVLQEALTYHVERRPKLFTVTDYRALPEERRVELIDGRFYDMAAPTTIHQRITGEVYRQISNYILDRNGSCLPFVSPVDVQLDCDEHTMVQPDVAILCDENKLTKWGIYGAPDFVLEVISPSTKKKDYTLKAHKYAEAGVREYWILDPYQKKLLVYNFQDEIYPVIYGLEEEVPLCIYNGMLRIDFRNIAKWIQQYEQL